MTEQALAGMKVLEFGNLVSAPYCGKLLADLGAEVIKVEMPGLGVTGSGPAQLPISKSVGCKRL